MKQKRFYYVLLVTVLGLLMLATAAIAQDANRVERIGTGVLVLGQPFVPEGVKDPAAADGAKALMPASNAAKLAIEPDATDAGFVYKVRETFEGVWPNGNWYTYDNNGATGGQVCWDDDDWIDFRGSWSGASMNGCANGVDPAFSYYPNNMNSWMVNGPFSTVKGKTGSQLNFKYWNQSELGFDYLWWCASPDGSNFYCFNHTGNSGGWQTGKLNLKNVPGYGNMLGDPTVWAAWVFTSDSTFVDDGAFVDNAGIVVKK